MRFPTTGTSYTICKTNPETFPPQTVGAMECCIEVYIPSNPCFSPPTCYVNSNYQNSNNTFNLFGGNSLNADSYNWDVPEGVSIFSATDESGFTCGITDGLCHTICLTTTNECGFSSYCVNICPSNSEICDNVPDYTANINPQISGNALTFSGVPSGAVGLNYQWTATEGTFINGTNNSQASPEISFASDGNYIVCLTLTDVNNPSCNQTCICWTINIGGNNAPCEDPVCEGCTNEDCDEIYYQYTGDFNTSELNYTFSSPDGGEIGNLACYWECYVGENPTGNPLDTYTGGTWQRNFDSPGVYTICYNYFDYQTESYRRCCRTFYISNPYNCGNESINYYYNESQNGYIFQLEGGNNFQNITWRDDDNGGINIGNGINSNLVGANCNIKNISVRYQDPTTGCWYFCCIRVYLCPPTNCIDNVQYEWDNAQNKFRFTLQASNVDAASIEWRDDTGGNEFGEGQTSAIYPFSVSCGERVISVRYRDLNTGCWYICCRRVYICDPAGCGEENIYITEETSQLSIPNQMENATWYVNDAEAGTSNTINYSFNPGNSYFVCVYYLDPSSNCWYVCCREINPNPTTAVTFCPAPNIIGGASSTVAVPVRVKNYNNVQGFQMTYHLTNSSVGQIVGTADYNLSLSNMSSDNFNIVNNGTDLVCTYYGNTANTLADNEIIFSILVNLYNGNTCSDITVTDTPTPIFVFDDNNEGLAWSSTAGDVCITSTSGQLGGTLRTETGEAIGMASVFLSGSSSQTDLVGSNGLYQFSNLFSNGNYTVTPKKDINLMNGVNVQDILEIQDYIQGDNSEVNTDYKVIAADVNSNGHINVQDLLIIQDNILNSNTANFPDTDSWKFVWEDYNFSTNPLNDDYPEFTTHTPLGGTSIVDNFIGIKMGDVTGDANPQNFTGEEENLISDGNTSVNALTISIPSANYVTGTTVEVPIVASNFTDVKGMQFSVTWDSEVLQYEGISDFGFAGLNENNFSETYTEEGVLTVVWFGSDCTQNTEDFTLLNLQFTVIGAENTHGAISVSNNPTNIGFYDCENAVLEYNLENAVITVSGEEISNTINTDFAKNVVIYPNPNSGSFSLSFSEQLESGNKSFAIYSLTGKLVESKIVSTTSNTISFTTNLSDGVYFIEIHNGEQTAYKRLVIQH